jgi:hypothetical protein
VNGKKVDRNMQREDNDTPTADEAFAKLPTDLKPAPAMTPIAEGFSAVFVDRHGDRVHDDPGRRVFLRELLQQGPVSERGDRFEFMRYHDWYKVIASNAFCKDCGLDPETFKKL